jgi:hypothetical protein
MWVLRGGLADRRDRDAQTDQEAPAVLFGLIAADEMASGVA